MLRFRNGVIGTIDNSRQAAYGYDQRVEILGSEGKIATANCYPNQAEVSTGKTVHRDLPLELLHGPLYGELYQRIALFRGSRAREPAYSRDRHRWTDSSGQRGWRLESRTMSIARCAWKVELAVSFFSARSLLFKFQDSRAALQAGGNRELPVQLRTRLDPHASCAARQQVSAQVGYDHVFGGFLCLAKDAAVGVEDHGIARADLIVIYTDPIRKHQEQPIVVGAAG